MVRLMRVAKVVVRADTTSFRHPFFVTGRQPTFDIPPPSTILGHCASALGKWPDRATFFFGVHFTYRSRNTDLEHQHITEALPARTPTRVDTAFGRQRATTAVTVQPVVRDFLYDVRLTLYLPPDLAPAFRAPVHTVVIGRSQDLAEVVSVQDLELAKADRARLEHTLLPQSLRPCVPAGVTVLLTRFVEEPPARRATFAQYISLHEPVFLGADPDHPRGFLKVEGVALDDLWVDPDELDDEGYPRGVWLHRLAD
jgi:CRISPR-associated protein Cas5t